MKLLLKTLCLMVLLSSTVVPLQSETSFDFTTSDGKNQWQIKVVLCNVQNKSVHDNSALPPGAVKNHKYLGSIYPPLLIPGNYPVIWRIYYKASDPKTVENPASALYLWQKIHAWHEAEQGFYRSKLTNPKKADNSLKKERLDKILQQGLQLFKQDKFNEAIQKLKEGILLEPEDGVIAILYGYALFAADKYSLATKALRRGMRSINDFTATPMDLREFYTKAEVLEKQITKLETWVKYHPEDLETLFLLGYVCFSTLRFDKAIDAFKLLRERNPLDREAELLLKKAINKTHRGDAESTE